MTLMPSPTPVVPPVFGFVTNSKGLSGMVLVAARTRITKRFLAFGLSCVLEMLRGTVPAVVSPLHSTKSEIPSPSASLVALVLVLQVTGVAAWAKNGTLTSTPATSKATSMIRSARTFLTVVVLMRPLSISLRLLDRELAVSGEDDTGRRSLEPSRDIRVDRGATDECPERRDSLC